VLELLSYCLFVCLCVFVVSHHFRQCGITFQKRHVGVISTSELSVLVSLFASCIFRSKCGVKLHFRVSLPEFRTKSRD
jgi:hypothetical protein